MSNKKSEEEFLAQLSEEGIIICSALKERNKSRKWLAGKLGISTAALNYKLKSKFTKSEEIAVKVIIK